MQKKLKKLQVFKGVFFSGRCLNPLDQKILHDINNMFLTLSYKIEIALGEEGEDVGVRVSGLRQAHFGASFIAQTLYYHERGHAEKELDVDAIIPFAYELVVSMLDSRKINFIKTYHQEHAERQYTINGDQLEMIRIVMNLIKNAAEELNKGEWIIVKLNKTDESIILTIHDTGSEMGAEKKARMKEIIETPDLDKVSRFTTKTSGSGWGLRIIREYVEANKGKIEFENDKQGSVFTLTFPKA